MFDKYEMLVWPHNRDLRCEFHRELILKALFWDISFPESIAYHEPRPVLRRLVNKHWGACARPSVGAALERSEGGLCACAMTSKSEQNFCSLFFHPWFLFWHLLILVLFFVFHLNLSVLVWKIGCSNSLSLSSFF